MIKHLKPRSNLEIANIKLQDEIKKSLLRLEVANNKLKEIFKQKPYKSKGTSFGLSHFRNSRAAQEHWEPIYK